MTVDLETTFGDDNFETSVANEIRGAVLQQVRMAVNKEMKDQEKAIKEMAKKAVSAMLDSSDTIRTMAIKAATEAVEKRNK